MVGGERTAKKRCLSQRYPGNHLVGEGEDKIPGGVRVQVCLQVLVGGVGRAVHQQEVQHAPVRLQSPSFLMQQFLVFDTQFLVFDTTIPRF